MADEINTGILRAIQGSLAAHGRKLDALTDHMESLFQRVEEFGRDLRALRGSSPTYQDLNRLESRVTALENSAHE